MTKDVLVSIRGMQFMGMEDEPDEPIEIVTNGNYYFRNGSHYVKYEEVFDGFEETTSNLLKIKPDCIELHKKGAANVHMVFEENKKNITYYETPFGKIQMGVSTTGIQLYSEENKMCVRIEYTLDMNDSYVADCTLDMNIQSKVKKDLH